MFNFFKSKKIVFKGRAGLIFNASKDESYFVDSEMLNGYYDLVINKNRIFKLPSNIALNKSESTIVIQKLSEELDKLNLKYEII